MPMAKTVTPWSFMEHKAVSSDMAIGDRRYLFPAKFSFKRVRAKDFDRWKDLPERDISRQEAIVWSRAITISPQIEICAMNVHGLTEEWRWLGQQKQQWQKPGWRCSNSSIIRSTQWDQWMKHLIEESIGCFARGLWLWERILATIKMN